MEPTLERRLRDADPLAHRSSSEAAHDQEWLREATRSAIAQEPRSRRPRTLIVGTAAAAMLIAAVAGGLIMRGGDDTTGGSIVAAATVTELAMAPDMPSMSSCVPFSVDTLAAMPVAFSGEVTENTPDHVLITVDTWYRGGDSEQVRLLAPDMSMTSLGETVNFGEGSRYLVTATDGTVNYCGFTGLWSQSLADAFSAAFGAGR